MTSPLVSVIIPAYNQAQFLGAAIRSVLQQTYNNLELLVVNDASPDNSIEVAQQFDDPRIKQLKHKVNLGLSAARNTGIQHSTGEFIALLDSDDEFAPLKIERHVSFLRDNPEVGVTYNNRYELNYSASTIREIYRAPQHLGLADFLLGFPFAPSDMVIRRKWLDRVGLFDEKFVFFGEDQEFYCRLSLAGCQFGRIDNALNYRRHHSGRYQKHIPERMEHNRQIIGEVVEDVRCPETTRRLKHRAIANHCLVQAFHALALDQTELGRELLKEAIGLDPELLLENSRSILVFFMHNAIADDSIDHSVLLHRLLVQLPADISWTESQYLDLVANGFLIKGARATLWDRLPQGDRYFQLAWARNASIDSSYLRRIAHQLHNIELELGHTVANEKLQLLLPYLHMMGDSEATRMLLHYVLTNRAFQHFEAGERRSTIGTVLKVLANDPKQATNRGLISIFGRSVIPSRPEVGT